ncbi:hypothetical protein ABZP36_029028 [Zizania latifolia]
MDRYVCVGCNQSGYREIPLLPHPIPPFFLWRSWMVLDNHFSIPYSPNMHSVCQLDGNYPVCFHPYTGHCRSNKVIRVRMGALITKMSKQEHLTFYAYLYETILSEITLVGRNTWHSDAYG